MLRVNRYQLAADSWDGGTAPSAWRISTPEGVFWIGEDTAGTRLIRLPSPAEQGDAGTVLSEAAWSSCEMLALAAETEAASRWTRGVPSARVGEIGEAQA